VEGVVRPLARRYDRFIVYLRHGFNVTDAAIHAEISRSSIYKRWITDPEFNRLVRESQEYAEEPLRCSGCGEVVE
jgi:hypothetical protein